MPETIDSTVFKKISEVKAYERIVIQIKELIENGTLPYGAKLPSESELAASFGVSRNTVRESLLILEFMGFVKTSKGKATEVTIPSMNSVLKKIAGFTVSERSFVSNLLETRFMLEPKIARMAAQRASDEEIAEMRLCLAKIEENMASYTDSNVFSAEIHDLVVKACHNEVLETIMTSLSSYIQNFSRFIFGFKGQPEKSLAEHREIVEAIAARDADAAEAAMVRHLEHVNAFYEMLYR